MNLFTDAATFLTSYITLPDTPPVFLMGGHLGEQFTGELMHILASILITILTHIGIKVLARLKKKEVTATTTDTTIVHEEKTTIKND